jgi:hypothetical protein
MEEARNTSNPDSPNQAADREQAEGSRENVESGISNRPIEEEQRDRGQPFVTNHDPGDEEPTPSNDATLGTKI